MNQLVMRILLGVLCVLVGFFLTSRLPWASDLPWLPWTGGLAGLLLTLLLLGVEKWMKKIPTRTLVGGITGFLLGLVVARLLMFPFDCLNQDSLLRYLILILLSGVLGYLGLILGSSKAEDISRLADKALLPSTYGKSLSRYILDTSVIIDGRIADICDTGFIKDPLIVPQFILQELHHIADSSDPLKKIRGRRGLEVIEKIQKQKDQTLIILDRNPPKDNVDAKLVDLALELNAIIISNDYNLSKVAELRGVKCLNLNKLANALKPAVLSGEVLNVQIIREGKTPGQGVAYMDDGTMVVVENARRFIGRNIEVVVTSVLQTGTGRMIFSEVKNG